MTGGIIPPPQPTARSEEAAARAPSSHTETGRSFDDAQAILCSLARPRRRGSAARTTDNNNNNNLRTTQLLLDALDLQSALTCMSFVHIAGTKGKGTTAGYTAALLQQAHGLRVGLFTSPHLTSVRERIVVNGRMLTESDFAQHFFELHDRLEALRYGNSELQRCAASSVHFFVFMFLLALHVFRYEGVEVAVMEVGIGGRLDATNVIPSRVSVITSIGYDHTELLGHSIAAIAGEKAGIIKAHSICYAARQADHPEARDVIAAQARRQEARLAFLDDDVFPLRSWPTLAMGGSHVVENSKLALCAARTVAAAAAASARDGNSRADGVAAAAAPMVSPLTAAERTVLQCLTLAGRSQVWPRVLYVTAGSASTIHDGVRTGVSVCAEAQSNSRTRAAAPQKAIAVAHTCKESEWNKSLSSHANVSMTCNEETVTTQWATGACVRNGGAVPVRLYLDGAHTVESISHMLGWFMRETAVETKGTTAAGAVRRVLVFYTSRAAEPMVRAFAPVVHALDLVIVVPICAMSSGGPAGSVGSVVASSNATRAIDASAAADTGTNPRMCTPPACHDESADAAHTKHHHDNGDYDAKVSAKRVKDAAAASSPSSSSTCAHSLTGARDAGAESGQTMALAECWSRVFADAPRVPPCRLRSEPFASMTELLQDVVTGRRGASGDEEVNTAAVHVLVCGSFYLVGEVLTLLERYESGREGGKGS